ncbi:MAG: AraC family transcriptional regulator [Clostridiales bacterium]|nr:AraC family transcriptional regulator [Clostridiales bacterium]
MESNQIVKRGYLNDNFRLFHLKDSKAETIDYHYHEFSKVILFISGNVTYMVEGKTYQLKPWDILLVQHHEIHRSIIQPGKQYERIILWINREFLEQPLLQPYNLNQCFVTTMETRTNLVRTNAKQRIEFYNLLNELKHSMNNKEFGYELYSYTLFLQAMIVLNRLSTMHQKLDAKNLAQSNQTVDQMIEYIQQNLSGDLSIETISKQLYLSSSYLMHLFKDTTGTSLHSYINKKRLSNAVDLLKQGIPATTASVQSGFSDYSTFIRNFRKTYHCTPKQYMENSTGTSPFPTKGLRE